MRVSTASGVVDCSCRYKAAIVYLLFDAGMLLIVLAGQLAMPRLLRLRLASLEVSTI